MTCASSWTPNARTFANRTWRQHSVRLGPVTLLNAERLADAPLGEIRTVKIRTLIRPDTPVTISVGATAPPKARVGINVTEAANEQALRYEPCPAVPRSSRAIANLPDVGFPLFVSIPGPVCVRVTVEAAGRSEQEVISLGAGRCPHA